MFGNKKTYTEKEVNEFINKQKKDCESITGALKQEIAELKAMLETEVSKNKYHTGNEDKIKEALLHAIEKAKAIESEGKRFYEAQLERVRLLYVKWVQVLDEIQAKYGIVNNEELNAQKFASEIEQFLVNTINVKVKNEPPVPVPDGMRVIGYDEKYYHKQLLSRMSGLMNSSAAKLKEEANTDVKVPLPKILFENKSESQKAARSPAQIAAAARMREAAAEQAEKKKTFAEDEITKLSKTDPSHIIKVTTVRSEPAEITVNTATHTAVKETKGAYASLMQKYTSGEEEDVLSSAYAKKLVKISDSSTKSNSSDSQGVFDIREVDNPRESLEDILKEFNFD